MLNVESYFIRMHNALLVNLRSREPGRTHFCSCQSGTRKDKSAAPTDYKRRTAPVGSHEVTARRRQGAARKCFFGPRRGRRRRPVPPSTAEPTQTHTRLTRSSSRSDRHRLVTWRFIRSGCCCRNTNVTHWRQHGHFRNHLCTFGSAPYTYGLDSVNKKLHHK